MSVASIQGVKSLITLSLIAGADIDAGKPIIAAGTVAAADAHIIGVSLQTVLSGEDLPVMACGIGELTAGGAITAGDYIKVGSSGKFLTADATAFAAGKVVGKALATAAGDGSKFSAFIGIL